MAERIKQNSSPADDFPRRGEIYWVNIENEINSKKDFKPQSKGAEQKKNRPGVIISNNKQNQFSGAVIVALITSQFDKVYFFEVEIEVENKKGKILTDQIYTIDKNRLGKRMGVLSEKQLRQLLIGLHIVLELNCGMNS